MTRKRMQAVTAIAIAAAAIAIFLHLSGRMREAANRSQCRNHLRSLCIGIHNYASANNDRLPRAVFGKGDLPPEQCLSWLFELDPYVWARMDPEWTRYRSEPWGSENNLRLARERNLLVNCPGAGITQSADGLTLTQYVGVLGVGPDSGRSAAGDPRAGILQMERWVRLQDVKDGTEFTIAIIETARENGAWMAGGRSTTRYLDESGPEPLGQGGQFGGLHRNHVNVAMLDGSSRGIALPFDRDELVAQFTIAGGEGVRAIPE